MAFAPLVMHNLDYSRQFARAPRLPDSEIMIHVLHVGHVRILQARSVSITEHHWITDSGPAADAYLSTLVTVALLCEAAR